jgi:HD-GYP domain-containing protein (c-di-GMP phosphodiesterase class II)
MNIHLNELSMYECLMNITNFMQPGLYIHQLRVAMLADKIAEKINLSEQRREILVYAALIHDLGMVLNIQEQAKINDAGKDAYIHAKAGYELIKDNAFFRQLGEIILHHHDWWDGSHPKIDSYEMRVIPIESRIIALAEEVTLYLEDPDNTRPMTELYAYLKPLGLHRLDPDLLRAFADISFLDKFWQEYTWPELKVYFHKYTTDRYFRSMPLKNIKEFADVLFALLVHWNMASARHSRAVANIAALIARLRNFDDDTVTCLYIAGLLHDLGKVAIPQAILAKTGELTTEEYKKATRHAYYTYWLLHQITGLEDIAKWAAYHHELLDGTGYPFGLTTATLPEEARIVVIANMLVNIGTDRNTQTLISLAKAKSVMQKLVRAGKIDKSIVRTIFTNGGDFQSDEEAVNF